MVHLHSGMGVCRHWSRPQRHRSQEIFHFFYDLLSSHGVVWGFAYILGGGVAYTIGAVLYLIGKKKPYRHFVFHVFVLLAAIIQFAGIYLYLLQ